MPSASAISSMDKRAKNFSSTKPSLLRVECLEFFEGRDRAQECPAPERAWYLTIRGANHFSFSDRGEGNEGSP
jgi:hypothetical protein